MMSIQCSWHHGPYRWCPGIHPGCILQAQGTHGSLFYSQRCTHCRRTPHPLCTATIASMHLRSTKVRNCITYSVCKTTLPRPSREFEKLQSVSGTGMIWSSIGCCILVFHFAWPVLMANTSYTTHTHTHTHTHMFRVCAPHTHSVPWVSDHPILLWTKSQNNEVCVPA